jgi:tRNA(Phe) wybutosine-synthesizing methylase Tyw3
MKDLIAISRIFATSDCAGRILLFEDREFPTFVGMTNLVVKIGRFLLS